MVKNNWNDTDAQALVAAAGSNEADKELALRVYTSRLIGNDPDLVMHGGGNTSVKVERTNLFGETEQVLHVKGSGWDLATIEAPGLPGVRIEPLLRLRELNELSDEDMVNIQRCNLLDSSSPNPSVETLLHAYLPHTYVDHTHATAFLVLVNQPDYTAAVKEVFGERLGIVPYIAPGFELSVEAAKIYESNPDVEGLILANHGHFTFGASARESYDRVIEHTNLVEEWLKAKTNKIPCFGSLGKAAAPAQASTVLPQLRGAIGAALATQTGNRDFSMPVLDLRSAEETKRIVSREDAAKLATCRLGTPDHVIRIKHRPIFVSPADLDEGRPAFDRLVKEFVDDYVAYFDRGVKRFPEGKQMVLPLPGSVWLPGLGVVGVGANAQAARIAADISEQTLQLWDCATELGEVEALGFDGLFDMEYWSLEQAKLGKGKPPRMRGKVVMITGGGGILGTAIGKTFAAAGSEIFLVDRDEEFLRRAQEQIPHARIFVTDVTAKGSADEAMAACATAFGGIDVLISNAGAAWSGKMLELDEQELRDSFELNYFAHRAYCVTAAQLLVDQGRGGQIIINVSKQAVNPGMGFGAYGMPKAASMFLVKQLALELGSEGIRVNGMNPDRIRSGILTSDFIAERAAARGVTPEEYMGNNLLKREVESHHVGDAFLAMATSERTTAHVMTVDGGNIEASLR